MRPSCCVECGNARNRANIWASSLCQARERLCADRREDCKRTQSKVGRWRRPCVQVIRMIILRVRCNGCMVEARIYHFYRKVKAEDRILSTVVLSLYLHGMKTDFELVRRVGCQCFSNSIMDENVAIDCAEVSLDHCQHKLWAGRNCLRT